MDLAPQLGVASAMVLMTILVHLAGLSALLRVLRGGTHAAIDRMLHRQVLAIVAAAVGLFTLHGVEIWLYAALYFWLGAAPDFEQALYFSTSTYTTVGYGDVVLGRAWRLVGAIEGANGIILLGWSTAFFVGMVDRIRVVERVLEHDH
jgi:voltage-gated potassium channel